MPVTSHFGCISREGFYQYSQEVLGAARGLDREPARQNRFLEARFDDVGGLLEGPVSLDQPCLVRLKTLYARTHARGMSVCREDYLGFFVNMTLITHPTTTETSPK